MISGLTGNFRDPFCVQHEYTGILKIKMKKAVLFLIAAALAAGQDLPESRAQAGAAAQAPMTLDECVKELTANNPDLYVAREGVNAARANLLGSYSPFLPQVSASGSASRNNQEVDTGYEATTAYNAGLGASQNLFNGFQDIARLNQSRAQLSQAEINLQRVKSTLSADVRQAFTELLYAQDSLVLVETILGRRKENSALVEMRFEAGSEDKGALLRSQALYSQATLDVVESKRQINVTQRNLNKVLGRQDGIAITVTGAWDHVTPPPPPEFQELAKTTPEYRKANAQCTIAREQIRVVRSDFFPSWSVSAGYGLSDDDSFIPHDKSWNVGTSIGLDIFNGGQTIFALRAAHAQLRSTEAQLTSTANSIFSSLEEKFTAWQNAVDRVRVQVQLLKAAETRMEIARIKYSNGLMSFQDWDTIENELITNQKSMLSTQRNAIIIQAEWEKAAGISSIP